MATTHGILKKSETFWRGSNSKNGRSKENEALRSVFGGTSSRDGRPRLTRPKAATPFLPPYLKGPLVRYGIQPTEKRFTAPSDWFVPDSYEQEAQSDDSSSTQSVPVSDGNQDASVRPPQPYRLSNLTVSQARPVAGQNEDDPYDPANHPDEALGYRNLTEFITVIRDKYKGQQNRTVLTDHEKLKRVALRDGELLVDIRRDVKDVFRSKVLVSGDGGRNVNVETRMDPKFEKVLVTSSTKDPEVERRNRERERCLWLQEDRMRWIRALYEHIKEFRTQAKFYLALIIEARGRDPEYDPEEDEQVVAIRKQMIPWADEVMSNVLLLAGIETQIYADLQKDMPSVQM